MKNKILTILCFIVLINMGNIVSADFLSNDNVLGIKSVENEEESNQKYALIIGVGDYPVDKYDLTPVPQNCARNLKNTLCNNGWSSQNITLLIDAKVRQIL